MLKTTPHRVIGALTIVTSLTLGSIAVSAQQTLPAPQTARCTIETIDAVGTKLVEAHVTSKTPLFGTYLLRVESIGRFSGVNIQKGGRFSLHENQTKSLEALSLDLQGNSYLATLKITANGTKFECSQRISV